MEGDWDLELEQPIALKYPSDGDLFSVVNELCEGVVEGSINDQFGFLFIRFEGGPKTNVDGLGDLKITSPTYQQFEEVAQGISKIILPKHRRFKGSVSTFFKTGKLGIGQQRLSGNRCGRDT
jgi:hypothetical protein